jgi:DNA-binding transcriptional ArsR family regulator
MSGPRAGKPAGGTTRRVLAALSHPTRRRILDYLQVHERASPGEISNAVGIPISNVSYHVRRLESLGYLRLVGRTQRRGAIEHFYMATTTNDPDRVIAQLAGRFLKAPDARLSTRALLDATAIAELHTDLERLFARARTLESQSVARGGLSRNRTFPVHVVCVVDAQDDAGR